MTGRPGMAESDLRQHWDGRYERGRPRGVSWFEDSPVMSLGPPDITVGPKH